MSQPPPDTLPDPPLTADCDDNGKKRGGRWVLWVVAVGVPVLEQVGGARTSYPQTLPDRKPQVKPGHPTAARRTHPATNTLIRPP